MYVYHDSSRTSGPNADPEHPANQTTRFERLRQVRFNRYQDRLRDYVFDVAEDVLEALSADYESWTNYHYSGADTLDTRGSGSRFTSSYCSEGCAWSEIHVGRLALRRYRDDYGYGEPYVIRWNGRNLRDIFSARNLRKRWQHYKIRRDFKRMTGEDLPF